METFWANGYDATSVPTLTEAMGISAQSLYAAFESKDALYREAIELYRSTVGGFGSRAMAEEDDAVAAMARLFRDAATAFSSSPKHPGCMLTMAPAGQAEDPLTVFGRQLRAEGLRQVKERLERGVRDGQLRADADRDAWARYVVGVLQGLSTQARDGETRERLLTTAEIAARSLDMLRK
jgi:AcrR family transcriptional regulator